MKCERCHKQEAEVSLTKSHMGKIVLWHLCMDCAKEEEKVNGEQDSSFQQFLSGLLVNNKSIDINTTIIECENCGMLLEDFKKNSQVGCSKCYKTFDLELRPIIKRIQSSTIHVGKRPNKIEENREKKHLIDIYQKNLKLVLEKEDYEQAVLLRDKIRELRGSSSEEMV